MDHSARIGVQAHRNAPTMQAENEELKVELRPDYAALRY